MNTDGLIWPVPSHYITAYFHDPAYPFRYIFEHPAIDIRASQGTNIKAAASGYVARVRWDTSSRYGYVMLIHDNGLSTGVSVVVAWCWSLLLLRFFSSLPAF